MANSQQRCAGFGRSFGGPGTYIQRAGEIERLPKHLKSLGARTFFLIDSFVLDSMGASLRGTFEASGFAHAIERFAGECCSKEIARVSALAQAAGADIVVVVGGGKTADTAKIAACATGARLAIVLTIASTGAPCSAIAVRYSTYGVYQELIFLPRNPDLVVVDSAVIAKAPARFLVAGVGDALSTWFEARFNLETRSNKATWVTSSTVDWSRAEGREFLRRAMQVKNIWNRARQRRSGMYLNRFNLKDRVAVVTGGAQAIGLACVEALSEAGAHVYIADRNPKAAEEGRAAMKAKGYATDFIEIDVTNSAQVDAAAARVLKDKARVDILVCNAGIARSETAAEDLTDEHWLNVIDVNLNGLFWCCRAFGRPMLEAGRGSVVNIGSMSGFIDNKPQPQAQYNASKAGVHHLTKSLAAEWSPRGVRVNAVAPTYINTPLTAYAKNNKEMFDAWIDGTPMARMGEPDEIASVVLFLASDAASLMTGSIVLADGGYTCW